MTLDYRTRVLSSVRRALGGEITPEMRAVTVECSPESVRVHVYVDGPVSELACEDFDDGAVAQLLQELSCEPEGSPSIDREFIRIDAPVPLPARGEIVFARAGERFVSPECQSALERPVA